MPAFWRGSQGEREGRRNERGRGGHLWEPLKRRGEESGSGGAAKERMGREPPASVGSRPPTSLPASSDCPPHSSLAQPGVGVGGFPGSIGTRGGGAQGRSGLCRAWNLRRGWRGRGEAARETQKEQFTEKYLRAPFGDNFGKERAVGGGAQGQRLPGKPRRGERVPRSRVTPAGGSPELRELRGAVWF